MQLKALLPQDGLLQFLQQYPNLFEVTLTGQYNGKSKPVFTCKVHANIDDELGGGSGTGGVAPGLGGGASSGASSCAPAVGGGSSTGGGAPGVGAASSKASSSWP